MGSKKHKKHKSDKRDRYDEKQFGVEKPPALKLILKVGNSSTPEHSSDSPGPSVPPVQSNVNYSVAPTTADEESRQSAASLHGRDESHLDRQHRKAKKKKKKKEKDKDKDKHEKKHKHHHKEKRKRPRDESSQDDVSMGEESLSDPPLPNKRMGLDGSGLVLGDQGQGHGGILGDGTHQLHQGQGCVSREPRSCVLRQRQERSPLQKLLDHLLKGLEKRDPQQFFAWPVTDHIAPGYSQIIHQPMDFSTMKQKIDDNQYPTLNDYIEDFKLMCNNAMVYNHPETIYYKAAKKLLHVGLKMMSPDKLKPLRSVVTYMGEITREELGFELGFDDLAQAAGVPGKAETMEDGSNIDEGDDAIELRREHRKKLKESNRPLSKFEAFPDDLTPEELLEQAQRAAQGAADRLTLKKANTKMGFLRQNKDGTTSLAILIPGEGVTPGTNERPISLGMLSGKLTHGTGQLQGFREDRRNLAKTVKPLYYGAFGSYAPSYDSTFANLTKEESDLVYQTYGDETSVQYAESILDFSKDCDYTLTMVDNLLDLLTGGEHRKTKRILEEQRRLREEEERVRQMLVTNPLPQPDVKIDIGALKSLNDIGVDMKFLDDIELDLQGREEQRVEAETMQSRLDHTSSLLQKLQQVQSDRLSLAPPPHLAHVPQPSENELQLAEKITENLKDMAKKVTPCAIASVPAIRKAMGIATEGTPPHPSSPVEVLDADASPIEPIADGDQRQSSVSSVEVVATPEEAPLSNSTPEVTVILSDPVGSDQVVEEVDVEGTSSQAEAEEDSAEVGGLVRDLESELREFLENEPALSNSPLQDDKTIEEILSES